MSDLYWLTDEQMARLEPYFPKSHGKPRVDDRRVTAGQVSDYTGAAVLLDSLPRAQWLRGDRGYDADWFRDALEAKGITPCIPGRNPEPNPSATTGAATNVATG